MYTKFNNIEAVITESTKYILENDRMLYADLLRITEEFCSNHGFLIANVGILSGAPINIDGFSYDIYITGGWDIAKELSTELMRANTPHLSLDTIELTSAIMNEEFSISVNMRRILRIFNLFQSEIINRMSVIMPGNFAANTRVADALIHLCNVYQRLYTFSNYKKWKGDLAQEDDLFNLFTVGKQSADDSRKFANPLSLLIYNNIEKFNGICIGDFCDAPTGRLQIISDLPIENCISIAKTITKRPIAYSTMRFMFDFRLKKYTLKIDGRDICDIFNSTTYELIPRENINASLFVQLRFALVQYFILSVVVPTDYAHKVYSRYLRLRKTMVQLRDILANDATNADLPEISQLFPKTVVGNNIKEQVSRKKLTEGQPRIAFYPAVFAKHGGGEMSATPGSAVYWTDGEPYLQIAQRITRDYRSDARDISGKTSVISAILDTFYKANAVSSEKPQWSSRNASKRLARYRVILTHIPKREIYIDIGSGDGEDFALFARETNAIRAIASDISDNRIDKKHEFALITLNKTLFDGKLANISLGFASFLHSIHHSIDAEFRIRDVAAHIKVGGVILVKDHDVIDAESANIVSFEHFVYSVGEGTATKCDFAKYQQIEPMYYYSAKQICDFITSLGFTRIHFAEPRGETRVYMAVFQKNKVASGGSVLYKGDFTVKI